MNLFILDLIRALKFICKDLKRKFWRFPIG